MAQFTVDLNVRLTDLSSRAMPVVIWIVKRTVFLYVFILALLYLIQDYAIFPGQLVGRFEPAYTPSAGVQPVDLTLSDGARVFGYYKPPEPGAGLIVTFHGNATFPGQHASRFEAGPWHDHGWGFLCVTYRGFARSTGSPSEVAGLADADEIVAFARQRAPDAPILFHGHSLGTAFATAMAAKYPNIGLFLDAPFLSMSSLVASLFPIYPTDRLLRHTFRTDLRIGAVRAPIVIVHGSLDAIVPFSSGKALADVAGPNARFIALPGDHFSILGARDRDIEAAFRTRFGAKPDAR